MWDGKTWTVHLPDTTQVPGTCELLWGESGNYVESVEAPTLTKADMGCWSKAASAQEGVEKCNGLGKGPVIDNEENCGKMDDGASLWGFNFCSA